MVMTGGWFMALLYQHYLPTPMTYWVPPHRPIGPSRAGDRLVSEHRRGEVAATGSRGGRDAVSVGVLTLSDRPADWLVVFLEHDWMIFPFELGMSPSQLTIIFFRGVETTNQKGQKDRNIVEAEVNGLSIGMSYNKCDEIMW